VTSSPFIATNAWHANAIWPTYAHNSQSSKPTTSSDHLAPGSLYRAKLDPKVGRDVRLELVEETSPVELPNGHSINLGTGLNSDERAIITPILVSNMDLFAWSATDLPGVDPLVALIEAVSHQIKSE